LKNLARDLEALALAGDKPAILFGHSIGGMIALTLCGLSPTVLGKAKEAGVGIEPTFIALLLCKCLS
jgi:pimeloyl-ACP methyl ester carboxylesterase